jgi:outer membrane protein OmpA-like peptidoglycan-associated protein
MKLISRILLLCAVMCFAFTLAGQDEPRTDAEGCKDSPFIGRMPGSMINSCDNKEFQQVEMPAGKDADGNAIIKTFEGEYHYWDIATREGMSEIQIYRNFETALKQGGFTIAYEDSPNTITAHKGDTWYMLESKGSYYYQTMVTVKAMKQEVSAAVTALREELNKSGHVAVYGIHFQTGDAMIMPDSMHVLGEVAEMLKQNPEIKVIVEGHTDNVGSAANNQDLSDVRAQNVMAWLTAHGVEGPRLSAKGWGQTKPVADNSTEPGRAKNRRVEFVKVQ